jgi:urease accessory protein
MSLLSLLRLLQLTDSAFPSGRYTLSHGLESFAENGALPTPRAPSLIRLLSDAVRFAVAPSDGVALACAHRAVARPDGLDCDEVVRADERLRAVKLAREGREASMRTGRALLRIAVDEFGTTPLVDYSELVDAGCAPGNHAVVLGIVCAWFHVPRVDAVAGELYAFSSGWVAAAVRLTLIDHGTAQRILGRVHPMIADAAGLAAERSVDDISSCAPVLDVMSMRHEEASVRLFAT